MRDNRDNLEYIDFLKFIGLSGIILAHVESPNWILMFRSFDVPLMVFISALLGAGSYDRYLNKGVSVTSFYIKRILRLIVPTYIFIAIYFILESLMGHTHEVKYYIGSLLLTRYGMGYVWIILIYVYCSILMPVFHKIGCTWISSLAVAAIYICYELFYYFRVGIKNPLIETTFYYIIPYGTLAYIGYNYLNMRQRTKIIIGICSLITFLSGILLYFLEFGDFKLVSIAKYPPRAYYLSYGMTCITILMYLGQHYSLKCYKNKIIVFISRHSMWIYLWHVIALQVYSLLKLPEAWYIKFVVIYSLAVAITALINFICSKTDPNSKIQNILKYIK